MLLLVRKLPCPKLFWERKAIAVFRDSRIAENALEQFRCQRKLLGTKLAWECKEIAIFRDSRIAENALEPFRCQRKLLGTKLAWECKEIAIFRDSRIAENALAMVRRLDRGRDPMLMAFVFKGDRRGGCNARHGPVKEKTAMQTTNRLLDDLAKVAGGALETFGGVRDEMRGLWAQQRHRAIAEFDLVPREEFDVVRAMAAAARQDTEAMADRLTVLEARLAKLEDRNGFGDPA